MQPITAAPGKYPWSTAVAAKPSLFKVLNVGSVRQLDHAVSLLNSCRILQVQTRGGDAEFSSAYRLVREMHETEGQPPIILFVFSSKQTSVIGIDHQPCGMPL